MTQKWQFVHLLDPLQGSQFNLYLVTERHKYGFSKQFNYWSETEIYHLCGQY